MLTAIDAYHCLTTGALKGVIFSWSELPRTGQSTGSPTLDELCFRLESADRATFVVTTTCIAFAQFRGDISFDTEFIPIEADEVMTILQFLVESGIALRDRRPTSYLQEISAY